MTGNWKRVNKSNPCPICHKADWCLISSDESAAICPRVESAKRAGDAGWLHRLTNGQSRFNGVRTIRLRDIYSSTTDFGQLAAEYRSYLDQSRLNQLSQSIGLKPETLRQFGVGWSPIAHAWAFPMREANGRTIGIQLRRADGRKLAVPGSRLGLFVPANLGFPKWLIVTEGMSDAASLVELGLPAIGRPSCSSGDRLVVDFVRRKGIDKVVVFADGDSVGQLGANRLGNELLTVAGSVKVVCPPTGIKDVRSWFLSGATREAVIARIREAPARQLEIHTRKVEK